MTALTLDGHLGATVDLDVCPACQVIWFDHLESLRLSPRGTLRLFQVIGERSQVSPSPLKQRMKCPRCDLRLLLTQDRQRNTQIEQMATHLREADKTSRTIDPLLPYRLELEKRHVEALFEAFEHGRDGIQPSSFGLVELGLRVISS